MFGGKKAKVLLVDDSPAILEQEKELLKKTGVSISTAVTGPDAIKKIHSEKPDIVFLDLMLPDMHGDAVCRFVKKDPKLAGTVVVIVTAKKDDATMRTCFACGCDAFVSKPFSAEEILNKLKVVLDEKGIYLDWDKLTEG